ncbi:hypothetical protein P171DRAFT_430746 [Karstenula rhodostoma CBS 690.94]|uniref:Uncharacterized protein n=1 Tax=Karstenula rhodostoma CBS 690.94 TaxID=1392251 RepID=A0A9P4PMF0_9PLEO|nr:hypothetical protein P171DRAFT_430746 [Karstenula rhodostoma CBS 690.94]
MARTKPRRKRPPRTAPLQKDTSWEFETKYLFKPGANVIAAKLGTRSLLDLPDELILLVISELLAIRLDQPQSLAFKNRHKETDRQYENYYRRSALYALCLTSKRLNRLAIPALYDAIVGSTTSYGIKPLRLVCRTLTDREELRSHVQYVENLLEDCLGNKLFNDLEDGNADKWVNEYFQKLAWIIRMCPNIQQMSVISIESPDFTFWRCLLDLPDEGMWDQDRRNMQSVPRHSLRKLQKLTLQTNVSEGYMRQHLVDLNRIYVALLGCSPLTELRASGVTGGLSYHIPSGLTFERLQRIEITECTLPFKDVDNLLSVCDNLRHFVCHWTFLWCQLSHEQVELLPNLQKHHKTMETLCLMASRAGFEYTSSDSWVSCPSLCQMATLKEAKLCNLFIPDKQCRITELPGGVPEFPIAPELPPSLENLTISYTMRYIDSDTWRTSDCTSLQRLAVDCTQHLPRLRDLVIQYEGGRVGLYGGDDEDLVRSFGEQGVRLRVVEKVDVPAMLNQD